MGDHAFKLAAKTPLDGLAPKTLGQITMREVSFDAITSVAPFQGQERAVSDALKTQIGAALPKPGRATGKPGARVVWSGIGQALVLGPNIAAIPGAALSDQSDAWACVAIEGDGVRDVLARLTPLDLRDGAFKTGHAARTEFDHMPACIMRTGKDAYCVMVFRSMAETLWHGVEAAMQVVAARNGF